MTNAEKFKEVFGMDPDISECPCNDCGKCPVNFRYEPGCSYEWWQHEYKGNDTIKIEITEHHTFAKPDDVSDIKFGD